jgi:hypothetical protein
LGGEGISYYCCDAFQAGKEASAWVEAPHSQLSYQFRLGFALQSQYIALGMAIHGTAGHQALGSLYHLATTGSFGCCNSQHQHTAAEFCLHSDGSADLLRVAVAQVNKAANRVLQNSWYSHCK